MRQSGRSRPPFGWRSLGKGGDPEAGCSASQARKLINRQSEHASIPLDKHRPERLENMLAIRLELGAAFAECKMQRLEAKRDGGVQRFSSDGAKSTYLADGRVIDAGNESVELVSHSLGSYTGGGRLEVLFGGKADQQQKEGERERGKKVSQHARQ